MPALSDDDSGLTLRGARSRFFARNGMPPDGGYAAPWWSFALGPVRIHLPNFAWRRRAVPLHDLHHILTGIPCTPVGEMQVAAFELAAGRFPSSLATAFCLPLVALGAVIAPRKTFAAFMLGRGGRTLYEAGISEDLLDTPLGALRARLLAEPRPTRLIDRRAFGLLVAQSFVLLSLAAAPGLALLAGAVALLAS